MSWVVATLGDSVLSGFRGAGKMSKWLTGVDMMQSGKNFRWLNWYVNRKRITPSIYQDAYLRKELRAVSWRRLI